MHPSELPNIRNITVSGRIASGATTLAHGIATTLGWDILEGGALFEKAHKELGITEADVEDRADHIDLAYEENIKGLLKNKTHQVIQSHLAGFDARGIPNIFKILVLCENDEGEDKLNMRIDRLVNRKDITVEEAKEEIHKREEGNLQKWRRLYAQGDEHWFYWDKKYYDLVVNTYNHNKAQSLQLVLSAIGYKDEL